jgi:hypothetical protein
MIEIQKWNEHKELYFNNEIFKTIMLNDAALDGINFNSSISFNNCKIEIIGGAVILLKKKVTLINCKINRIAMNGVHFIGGLEMIKCSVKLPSEFDATDANSGFIIGSCIFEGYIDFFDSFFEGGSENNKQ